MSGPIYGGNDPAPDKQLNSDDPNAQKGVYATYPAATPKYNASNHLETLDTQARLYIDISDPAAYRNYLDAIPPRARGYAQAMARTFGSSGGKGYLSFFLQAAQEPLREKVQVSEVLSDGHIAYFFGQAAPVWSYQIGLINSQQDEWYDAWNIVYENIIRGTRLAEAGTPVTLAYDTRRVIGSLTNTQTALRASNELSVSGSFSLLVKEVQVAVRVTESLELASARDILRQQQDSQLDSLDDQTLQSETLTLPSLGDARQRAQTGNLVPDLDLGIRTGYNPAEIEEKTGVVPTNQRTEDLFRSGSQVPLPPPELLNA